MKLSLIATLLLISTPAYAWWGPDKRELCAQFHSTWDKDRKAEIWSDLGFDGNYTGSDLDRTAVSNYCQYYRS